MAYRMNMSYRGCNRVQRIQGVDRASVLLNQADQGQAELPLALLGPGLRARLNKVWSGKGFAVGAPGNRWSGRQLRLPQV